MVGGGIGVTPYASILNDLVFGTSTNRYSGVACKKVCKFKSENYIIYELKVLLYFINGSITICLNYLGVLLMDMSISSTF